MGIHLHSFDSFSFFFHRRSICLHFPTKISRPKIMIFFSRGAAIPSHCIFITLRVSVVTVTILRRRWEEHRKKNHFERNRI
ncbi:hypothetical protein PUN28_018619 [Cardiocondyla obscurior]|uniref:Uncharacterized protein n=1 Tax=Cardiocondyla obscurior TaxID=286306 RepID=A0AAW2EFP3_9HYME